MQQLYDYIATELFAPDAAMDQYNRIAEAIMSLAQLPERIKLMDAEPERSRQMRRMNVDNYSVFFFIHDDTVIIIDVLYGATDISARLRQ